MDFKPTRRKMVRSLISWHLHQILILLQYFAHCPIWLTCLFNLKSNRMLHYMVFPPKSCALALVLCSPPLIPPRPGPAPLATLWPIKTSLTARPTSVTTLIPSVPSSSTAGWLFYKSISSQMNESSKKSKTKQNKKPMYYWSSDSPSVNNNVLHIVFTQ